MGEINDINTKNRSYYFYCDIINLDEFDGRNIKVNRKSFTEIDIYYLGYEHKKNVTECNVMNSVNPLYLRITNIKGQFKKCKDDNVWYLIIFCNEIALRKYLENLQIFGKVLELKLTKIQTVLYSMIKIT